MARAKAPVYKRQGTPTCAAEIEQLRKVCAELKDDLVSTYYNRLMSAIDDVETACRAVLPISKGGHRVGFGVDKAQKNITIATAIEILRQIKAEKAW